MNLWNTKDLPEPPINTYKAVNSKIDIKYLYDVFQDGTQFFDDKKFMYAEHAVLSRILYRMKQKFRSAKDFKALEKINKALDNYFKMDISRNLKNFMELIPSRYKQVTYLPTKNLLDYILVRLQGSVKLMERIIETCKIAAYLLDKRMHTGHFWKIAFIAFSIISRLYILAKYTAKFVCEFYSKLIPFSSQLKNTSGWSPCYEFPKNLKDWMNVDWLEVDDEIEVIEMPTEIPDIIQFFDLVDDDDDDVQFCDEYFIIKDDDDEEVERNLKKIGNTNYKNLWELRGFDTREDVGEVIEINDSMQILDENSFLEKLSNGKNDSKQCPTQSDSKIYRNTNKHDATVCDDSVQFVDEDSNNDVNRVVDNFKSQQGNPKTFTEIEEETSSITIPDTPLVDRKEKIMKNEIGRKYNIKNGETISITVPDTPLVDRKEKRTKNEIGRKCSIKNGETISITIPDTPLVDRKEKRMKNEIGRKYNIRNGDTLIISNNSVQFENNNIDADGGVDNSMSLQENCKIFARAKEKIETVTIPDTPKVVKKEKSLKNEIIKFKKEKSEAKLEPDIDRNVTESDEDTVISLSDMSFNEMLGEKPVKMKKRKMKKPIQDESVNMQSSHSFISPEVTLVENSFSKKPFKRKHDVKRENSQKNILSSINKQNFTDNSVHFLDNSIHTITIPDTPLVVKKEKSLKNETGKLKMEKSEFKFKPDTTSEIFEDPAISLSDTSFRETIAEMPVKKKKWKTKKLKQNGSTAQGSNSFINEFNRQAKKKKKIVKPNQNEGKLKPDSKFNDVRYNTVKKKKKTKKNNQNGGRNDNNQNWNILYQRFKVSLNSSNDFSIQNEKLPDQRTSFSKTKKGQHKLNSTGQVLNLGQQSGVQSTETFSISPRKRKIGTNDEDLPVKRLKKAISKTEKTKKILERKLYRTKQNLKKLSSELSGEVSSIRESKGTHTNKTVKSNKKRRMKKKQPMRTETQSHSNTPKIIHRLKRNTSFEHTQQNTKPPRNNSPTARNINKNSPSNNPKIIHRLKRNTSFEHTQQNTKLPRNNSPKVKNTNKNSTITPKIIDRLNRNTSFEHTQQNTKLPRNNSPTARNTNKNSPSNTPKIIHRLKRNTSFEHTQQNTKLPRNNSPKVKNTNKNSHGITPKIIHRLNRNTYFEHTQQNTNLPENNSPKARNTNKNSHDNTPKTIHRLNRNTSFEHTQQNTKLPRNNSPKAKTRNKNRKKKQAKLLMEINT